MACYRKARGWRVTEIVICRVTEKRGALRVWLGVAAVTEIRGLAGGGGVLPKSEKNFISDRGQVSESGVLQKASD